MGESCELGRVTDTDIPELGAVTLILAVHMGAYEIVRNGGYTIGLRTSSPSCAVGRTPFTVFRTRAQS